jgi:gas vesicle protein
MFELFEKPKKDNTDKIFIFSFLSAIFAAVVTFFFTPVKGEDARKMAAKKGEKAVKIAKKKAGEVENEIKKEMIKVKKAAVKTTKTVKKAAASAKKTTTVKPVKKRS